MAVSEADVAHVRAAFLEFNERYDKLRDAAIDAYRDRYYAPGAVIEHVDGFPMPGRYEGAEGYRRWFRETYSPYRDINWEIKSIAAVGDRVVALVRISGRPADDPVRLEVALGITYEMSDDGRIAHARVYLGHDRAVDAARSGG